MRKMAKLCIMQSIVCIVIFLIACSFNMGRKYVRFSHRGCKRGALDIYLQSSDVCCEIYSDSVSNKICHVTYNSIDIILSSIWAWAIALTPLICTAIGESVSGILNLKLSVKRLLTYLVIMIFRLIVLFLFAAEIQNLFTYIPRDCWYKKHMRNEKCKSSFDFSDHIVLYLVHYLLPVSLELQYVFERQHIIHPPLMKGFGLLNIYIPSFEYWATIISATIICILSYRGIFITALLFHTALESFVAMIIGLLTIWLSTWYLIAREFISWRDC